MTTSGVWEVVLLPRSYSQIPHKQQAPVVQTLDSTIHRINHYPGYKWCISVRETNCAAIHWIVIYPLDSVIQFLKNWGLDISVVKLNLLTGLQIFSSLRRTTVLVRHHLGRTSPKKGLNFISVKTEARHTKSMLFGDFEIILTQSKIYSSQGRYLFFLTFKIIYDKKIFTQVGFCRTLANLSDDRLLFATLFYKATRFHVLCPWKHSKVAYFYISYSKTVFCLTCLMPE